jgi:hypothetical protein
MTREFLDDRGTDNLLYAYSPDAQGPGKYTWNGIREMNMWICSGWIATTGIMKKGQKRISIRCIPSFFYDRRSREAK